MNLLLLLLTVVPVISSSEIETHLVDVNHITRDDAVDVLSSYQYNYYLTFDQIVARILLLQEKFPDKITVRTAGHSVENRIIYLVIISDKIPTTSTTNSFVDNVVTDAVTNDTRRQYYQRLLRTADTVVDPLDTVVEKPVIFVDGGIHAREWVSPAAALFLIEKLLETPHLTSKLEWRVIPLVNPDGYEYSRTRSRLWRKNRAKTSGRCRGVDLNRNFPVYHHRTTRLPCSETYGGPAPFSEPETRAIRDAVTEVANRTQAYVTLHTYGQLILHPYGYTKGSRPPSEAKLVKMGNGMAIAIWQKYKNSYRVRQASILGAAAGGSDDWAYLNMRIPYSYTFELQDRVNVRYQFTTRGFVLSPSKLPQAVDECWIGLEYLGNEIIKEQEIATREKPITTTEKETKPQVQEDSDEEEDSSEKFYPMGWDQVVKGVQRVRMEVAESSHGGNREDCVRKGNMYICPHMVFWGTMYNQSGVN